MFQKILVTLLISFSFFAVTTVKAQTIETITEFPIAVEEDTCYAGGGAFDGTNGLVTILGDKQNKNNITAQFISESGILGQRISLGQTGAPFAAGLPVTAFDGTNYLIVWAKDISDFNYKINGQFINKLGNLIGEPFEIGTATFNNQEGEIGSSPFVYITFDNDNYLVTWINGHSLIGQFVNKSGNLIGEVINISDNVREYAIAFDGTNFFASWVDYITDTDISISGQFISKQGALIGSKLSIDNSSNPSDNPISICFDGSRYLVVFHEQINEEWDLFGRFVSQSGFISERIPIVTETGNQQFPSIAFDGTNYLITWIDGLWSSAFSKGRFFNNLGVPVDSIFTIFTPLDNKLPIFTGAVFAGDIFCIITTRVDFNLTDGNIYGAFISPITGVDDNNSNFSKYKFELMNNYPNPFNPSTKIKYTIPKTNFVSIKIYDILGKEISTLVNEEKSAGTYEVEFNAKGLSSGMYFYKLESAGFVEVKKMLMLK